VASSRGRQVALLGALVVVLAIVLKWNLGRPAAETPGPKAAARPAPHAVRPAGGKATPVQTVEALRLDQLGPDRPEPSDPGRDLFRFGAGRTEAGGPTAIPRPGPAPVEPAPLAAPGPPMTPPIALKFVGIVHPAHQTQIAVLSDGRNVFYGREGETIDGRYRIERIGVESIEMAWVDGRGRQVIRLSGS
jgi:hypothetical protein